tara:strand:+ start:12328 stop:12438 length:111 start_codon:yes stop_codon:yes gene_type:complete
VDRGNVQFPLSRDPAAAGGGVEKVARGLAGRRRDAA